MSIPEESNFLVGAIQAFEQAKEEQLDRFVKSILGHWSFANWPLTSAEMESRFAGLPDSLDAGSAIRELYALQASKRGKSRYGDKTPSHVMAMPLLARVLPESVFIHLIRDGRDVVQSLLESNWSWPKDVASASLYWGWCVSTGQRAGRLLGPDRYHELRYENLVADPVPAIREMCRFVKLEYQPTMLEFNRSVNDLLDADPIASDHEKLRHPITGPVRNWREDMASSDVAICELLVGDLLDSMGYRQAYT